MNPRQKFLRTDQIISCNCNTCEHDRLLKQIPLCKGEYSEAVVSYCDRTVLIVCCANEDWREICVRMLTQDGVQVDMWPFILMFEKLSSARLTKRC